MILLRQQRNLLQQERDLNRAVISGQEQEQSRIAQEIHDGLGVEVIAAKQMVRQIAHSSNLPQQAAEQCAQLNELLEKIYQDQRRISHNLMPSNLQQFGILEALRELTFRINEMKQVNCEYAATGNYQRRLPGNTELAIYRIAQEGIHNTIKHAQATSITVNFNVDQEGCTVTITDNGKGFDGKAHANGLGVKSMSSRAALADIHFDLQSSPGSGTTIQLKTKY
ncbi:MAG: sensor histidine kinase [Chitinophagales bacterium]